MLPPWMIEEIEKDEKRREVERDADRPRVYIDDTPPPGFDPDADNTPAWRREPSVPRGSTTIVF